MTFKQRAHQLIDSLPEEPTPQQVEETLQELFDNIKIEEGLRASRAGETLSHDEVKQRMSRWLSE